MFLPKQMSERIVAAVVLAFLVFATYSWFSTKGSYDGFMDINKQMYESAEVEEAPVEASLTRVVSPGGPSAPNQRAPRDASATVAMDERPFDPQDQPYESAELPERLRHPERMFGPGLDNTTTEDAVAAGTASYAQQATDQAYQTFGPEFAQNGGVFMDGIIANDTSINQSYSSV
jgi:hypothetical protein